MRFLSLMLVLLPAILSAQEKNAQSIKHPDKRPTLYFEVGAGTGNFNTLKFGVNTIIKQKHCVSLLAYVHWKVIEDYPADFTPGWGAGIEPGKGYPINSVIYGAATYGRIIKVDEEVRFNLKGGVAAGAYSEPVNFRRIGFQLFDFDDRNYSYDRQSQFLLGILLNPTMEFTFTRGWGLNVGISSCLNNSKSTIGIEVGTIFGKLGRR